MKDNESMKISLTSHTFASPLSRCKRALTTLMTTSISRSDVNSARNEGALYVRSTRTAEVLDTCTGIQSRSAPCCQSACDRRSRPGNSPVAILSATVQAAPSGPDYENREVQLLVEAS